MKLNMMKLISKKDFCSKPIIIFGNTRYTYDMLKVLVNNQITVCGIITSQYEARETKKAYGISLITFEQFKYLYVDGANILIEYNQYKMFGKQLYQNGYIINKNLFINFQKINGKFWVKCELMQLYCKISSFPHNCKKVKRQLMHHINVFCDYLEEIKYILKGYQVYNQVQSKYSGDLTVLVYDYSGLGDVFVLAGLIAENRENIYDGQFILTVIGNASKKVASMYDISNVVSLSKSESLYISHFAKFLGKKYKVYCITPFSRVMYTEKISNSLAGYKINMLEMYKYLFFHLDNESKFSYPVIHIDETIIENIFLHHKLQQGNTVILSPYANTVIGFPVDFWISLSRALKSKGYCVCTNCGKNELEIPETIRLEFGLDIAEKILDYAGYFVALRNGFCDIVCNSAALKILIYPIYDLFNSNVFEFCSLEKMGIGRNYIEIKWKYNKFDKLINIICDKIIQDK